jgi:hypothetical protein
MGVIIFLLVLAVIGWAAFTQIIARQQTSITCSYDLATARRIVSQCFGSWWWTAVPGRGDDNYRPRRGSKAPVLSISYDMTESGRCDVAIWCSAGVKNYGLLNHAQLMWRKKRAVAQALAQAQPVRSQVLTEAGVSELAPADPQGPRPPAKHAKGASKDLHFRGADRIPAQPPEQPQASQSKAADGSKMIVAWLDELARIQPHYGALLRSTAEEVGPLPAISDDGNIYTVSHRNFAYATGYVKAFASRMAEGRHIQAVIAGEDARKTQDELAMVRKDDEGRFWADVTGWIEDGGIARMRPDVTPEWLASFHPTYLP